MDSVIYKLMNNIYKYIFISIYVWDIFNTFYIFLIYVYVAIISDEELTNVVRRWGTQEDFKR